MAFALVLLRPFRSFHPLTLGRSLRMDHTVNSSLRHGSTTRNNTLRTRTSRYPNRARGEFARGLRSEARGSTRHEMDGISCRRRATRFFRAWCCFYVTQTQVRNSSSHAFFFWRVCMDDSIQMLSILRTEDNKGATHAETIRGVWVLSLVSAVQL